MHQRIDESLMNVIDLFAGSLSFTKVAKERGHNTFSTDIAQIKRGEYKNQIDYVVDFLEFDPKQIPFKNVDVLWASPPCKTFSICAVWKHRRLDAPMTEQAILGDKLVNKTLEIIKIIKPKFWFIENPRGLLRKQKFMSGIDRRTVWLCQYGHHLAKPTDIWSNSFHSLFNPEGWNPRPECFNGNDNCHHEKCERGSTTSGVQGMSSWKIRSVMPPELPRDILKHCEQFC
jgi:site-specific DNA-cytosine methylase